MADRRVVLSLSIVLSAVLSLMGCAAGGRAGLLSVDAPSAGEQVNTRQIGGVNLSLEQAVPVAIVVLVAMVFWVQSAIIAWIAFLSHRREMRRLKNAARRSFFSFLN